MISIKIMAAGTEIPPQIKPFQKTGSVVHQFMSLNPI